MDALSKRSADEAAIPTVFSGYELESCYLPRRGFNRGALRELQLAKGLQVILSVCHGIVAREPEEMYQHATLLDFTLRKAYRMPPGNYLMIIVYRLQGETWRHVFRYERNLKGERSVSGWLSIKSRRLVATK